MRGGAGREAGAEGAGTFRSGRALSDHYFLDHGFHQLGGAVFGAAKGGFDGVAEFHVNRLDTHFAANRLARLP
jgi:hypothetical protein